MRSWVAGAGRAKRMLVSLGMAAVLLVGAARVSTADDDSMAFRDLAIGSDFRVRVAAALVLGKSSSPGARPALEKALGDPHPAVRAASSAGLGAIGDSRALAALKGALEKETTENVKAQLQTTIKRLSGGAAAAPATKAKFLIALGRIENRTTSGSDVTTALKAATRSKMGQIPGIEVLADGADVMAVSQNRHLPGFTVDGSLTELAKKTGRDGITVSARVEYLLRKEQALKGTMSGKAQALADVTQVKGKDELAQLQMDAVGAAIDSALKGVSPALEAAVK